MPTSIENWELLKDETLSYTVKSGQAKYLYDDIQELLEELQDINAEITSSRHLGNREYIKSLSLKRLELKKSLKDKEVELEQVRGERVQHGLNAKHLIDKLDPIIKKLLEKK